MEFPYDDWAYYRSLACWEPLDAARLLFKLKNKSWPNDNQANKVLNAIAELYKDGMLDHSTVALEEMPRHNFYKKNFPGFILDIGDWEYVVYPKAKYPHRKLLVVFLPIAFIKWAERIGIDIPPELEIEAIERGPFDPWQARCQFKKLKKKKNSPPLERTEAQELGRLRKDMGKWNESLKAIVEVVRLAENGKYKLTKTRLKTFMEDNFPEIECHTMNERLWAAVPQNLKNSGSGNPKEPMERNV